MNCIDILIASDDKGGEIRLTNQTVSSCGVDLVLSIEAEDISDNFGPSDLIDFSSIGGGMLPAEDIVAGWLQSDGRSPEERVAARLFLHQRG